VPLSRTEKREGRRNSSLFLSTRESISPKRRRFKGRKRRGKISISGKGEKG